MSIRAYLGRSTSVFQPGQIVYLIGEHVRSRLSHVLGAYLNTDHVERVVVITRSSAAAAEIVAPYSSFRENGRLVVLVAIDDLATTLAAAQRGWGRADILIGSLNDHWGAARPARPHMPFVTAERAC